MGGCLLSFICTERTKKKQCCFLRRMRAAVKKAVKNWCGGGRRRRQVKFQYDPWSYALNFDDGFGDEERANAIFHHHASCSSSKTVAATTATLVFVLWLEA
ncbi:unnamed protein product [Cuscuta epithymum]|uniref:Uncharacterized protein n=1 Tax=Cuscuta epithymum TaxID=186058 RepID=A0AAV0FEP6_9ASTE|nr:unnamed protein product [Cuscuta epithymum]